MDTPVWLLIALSIMFIFSMVSMVYIKNDTLKKLSYSFMCIYNFNYLIIYIIEGRLISSILYIILILGLVFMTHSMSNIIATKNLIEKLGD